MSEKVQPAQGKRGDYSMLFSPFRIRDVELHNRLVFQPHFTALGSLDGQTLIAGNITINAPVSFGTATVAA